SYHYHPSTHPSASLSIFFFHCSADHPDLHSFPTRRSSDLASGSASERPLAYFRGAAFPARRLAAPPCNEEGLSTVEPSGDVEARSEEHTSELQSRGHLVCRLLLEKKKKKE